MAVVIASESNGVLLGVALGLALWSKEPSNSSMWARTFQSEAEAEKFMSTGPTWPTDTKLVPVEPDEGAYASSAACERAGLPGWAPSKAA